LIILPFSKNQYQKMNNAKVLITGAAGYMGTVLLQKLHKDLEAGKIDSLIASDLREQTPEDRLQGVFYEQADITDPKRIEEICKKHQPTVIIHLAAVLDSQSMPRELQYKIDVEGTENLLQAGLANGCKRIIISSSGAAYGYYADNPEWLTEDDPVRGNEIFPYSDHKRLVEEMLARYRKAHPELEQTIFRIGTILGASTDNLITRLFHKKRILGLKKHLSPFVFVWDEDVANAMRHAVFSEQSGIYNLIGDGAIANRDLARILGKPYRAFRPAFLRFLLKRLHALKLSPYGPDQLLFLQYRPVMDNRKLKEEFGYTPAKSSLETFCFYLENQGIKPQNLDKINILYPKQVVKT
jgi:UDP-glucose 4-epimerase